MSDKYLAAECVFNNLIKSGFVYNREWKHKTRELFYDVSFELVGTRASIISFLVFAKGDECKIMASGLRVIEKLFCKDFSSIFTNCAIK
jgi:hypothetical protein